MACPISPNKRKANYAFCVKLIMPDGIFLMCALVAIYCTLNTCKNNYLRHFILDVFRLFGIIRLTLKLS